MNVTLWIHEWLFVEELHFVSGCMQAPERGLTGSAMVEMGLHSLICGEEKKTEGHLLRALHIKHTVYREEMLVCLSPNVICTLPQWQPLQQWWSRRIAAWSDPVPCSPCTALMKQASGSGSPQWHSYPYSNTLTETTMWILFYLLF